ncbi:YbgF trimerization domain-containing protein [Acinetobacter sp. ANC 4178]|uniref:YbgF trimerization domain-containing protein n=1 Tax=Acinetobacter sp. ANC 4178 TaxID=2529839 RepID=UPI00103AE134|nr:YbgF trimerization domain-containing protein [Acinetobacter sp. ANC 4178]TCB66530.1 tetratricopeptide repeat protein [Acinetobacter sp. ANC 4178]
MMQYKHAIYALTLLSSSTLYANVPIETRGLSQSDSGSSYTPSNANSSTPEAAAPTNLNWQLMQKNQQLENDIRSLRGRIEEQENTIEQLKNDLNNRYTDLDQRLELLQQKIDPDSSAPTEDNQQDTSPSSNATTSTTAPAVVNNASNPTPVATAPTKAINTDATLTTSNQQQTTDLEKAAYTVALDAYKQGGAKKAIAPMQNFIKNHPNSIYISNAYFWLAEFNLAIEPTNYTEAKRNYNIVVNQYPQSSKAARALYQLYSIAKDVDRNTALANQYKTRLLKQYPKSEEAGYFKK